MKFRKKPVVIEAFQMTPEHRASNADWPTWMHWAWQKEREESNSLHPTIPGDGEGTLSITTLKGEHLVSWGDWIIQGVAGELYLCKPEIFAATYEPCSAYPPPGGTMNPEQLRAILSRPVGHVGWPDAGTGIQAVFLDSTVVDALLAALGAKPATVPHCNCLADKGSDNHMKSCPMAKAPATVGLPRRVIPSPISSEPSLDSRQCPGCGWIDEHSPQCPSYRGESEDDSFSTFVDGQRISGSEAAIDAVNALQRQTKELDKLARELGELKSTKELFQNPSGDLLKQISNEFAEFWGHKAKLNSENSILRSERDAALANARAASIKIDTLIAERTILDDKVSELEHVVCRLENIIRF